MYSSCLCGWESGWGLGFWAFGYLGWFVEWYWYGLACEWLSVLCWLTPSGLCWACPPRILPGLLLLWVWVFLRGSWYSWGVTVELKASTTFPDSLTSPPLFHCRTSPSLLSSWVTRCTCFIRDSCNPFSPTSSSSRWSWRAASLSSWLWNSRVRFRRSWLGSDFSIWTWQWLSLRFLSINDRRPSNRLFFFSSFLLHSLKWWIWEYFCLN